MSEESFSQLSRSLGTFLSEMNAQDRDAASTNGQPTGLGNLGPVFTAQTTGVRSGSKSSGAKPTRTFLWLGSDTTASNAQGQVEGKRIKFDKSFNGMEMLSLLKREFKEIGNAR